MVAILSRVVLGLLEDCFLQFDVLNLAAGKFQQRLHITERFQLNQFSRCVSRRRRQSTMRNGLVEATEKIIVGKRDDTFVSFPLAPMNESSFLKGTSLHTGYKRSPSQNAQKCTVTLINLMVSPTMNLEKLAVRNSDESEKIRSVNIEKAVWMKRPQLEIRRPGYSADEVDTPVVKLVHPVDSHGSCFRVKPKLQVRIVLVGKLQSASISRIALLTLGSSRFWGC
jgi:hypothetical protein